MARRQGGVGDFLREGGSPGKTVAVGDGAVGLLAVLAAKRLGAQSVIEFIRIVRRICATGATRSVAPQGAGCGSRRGRAAPT